MKKASSILLFSIFNPQKRFFKAAPFLSRNYISSSTLHSTGRPLQTHGCIFQLHRFQTNPSRNLCTLAVKPTHLSSTQRKQREKSDLEGAFRSAQTSDEMLRAFEDMEMEGCFDEWELGMASLKVAKKLDEEGDNPEKTLSLAERGLKVLNQDQDGKASFFAVMALQLMGSACRSLNRVYESECYFNRARRLLDRLEDGGCHSSELELTDESLSQRKKPFEINSVSVKKALDVAEMQMESGKYDEAINTLEAMLEHTTENNSDIRLLLFLPMAKALSHQKRYADSKKYLESSCGLLEKMEKVFPIPVAKGYSEISRVYESMNEFEIAISFLKKMLPLLEKEPEEQKSDLGHVRGRIGQLHMRIGEWNHAIPYLETAVERLKESFVSEPLFGVYIYYNLGIAYLGSFRPVSAEKTFAAAKDIMDDSLDPHNENSITACQNLSKAYSNMGSFTTAIELQQRVVDALESLGPNAEDELSEARLILEELKNKKAGSHSHH